MWAAWFVTLWVGMWAGPSAGAAWNAMSANELAKRHCCVWPHADHLTACDACEDWGEEDSPCHASAEECSRCGRKDTFTYCESGPATKALPQPHKPRNAGCCSTPAIPSSCSACQSFGDADSACHDSAAACRSCGLGGTKWSGLFCAPLQCDASTMRSWVERRWEDKAGRAIAQVWVFVPSLWQPKAVVTVRLDTSASVTAPAVLQSDGARLLPTVDAGGAPSAPGVFRFELNNRPVQHRDKGEVDVGFKFQASS